MYQRILVPVDGSHQSAVALEKAIQLAQQFQAELFIATVIDQRNFFTYNRHGVLSADFYTGVASYTQHLLNQAQIKAKTNGVLATTILAKGIPKKIIAHELPHQYNIDLVIIGKSQRDVLAKLLSSSTSNYVIRYGKSKVLVVNHENSY